MDSYFANLRKSSGALELVLRNDDACSRTRPRVRSAGMKKPSSCPNYDAPNCPARKASYDDLDGYGSVHTIRTRGRKKRDTLQDFYDEVAPGLNKNPRKSSVRRKDANAAWDTTFSPPNGVTSPTGVHERLSLRKAKYQKDRSILFQGMVSEVLQCHNDILGTRDDARALQVKKQLADYIKAVEGLVVDPHQAELLLDSSDRSAASISNNNTTGPPPPSSPTDTSAIVSPSIRRSPSAKRDARWSARPDGLSSPQKHYKKDISMIL